MDAGRLKGALDDFGRDFGCSLSDIAIEILAGDHEAAGNPGGSKQDRRAGARGVPAVCVRVQCIEFTGSALIEVVQIHNHLHVGFARAKTDDGPAQLIALIHFGEHATNQPSGGRRLVAGS